jgi:hypothetical protein
MDHFSENAWVDVARGFSASKESQGLKAHLAAGCMDCKAAHVFWARLQTMALAESSYAPPLNLVRLAKLEPEKWTLASLLFDSVSQPLLAGVRSSAATARQLVYEAEGLVVDLRFDRLVPSGMLSAVGQILDKRVPRKLLSGSPVVVWTDDGQLVATTEANGFGEFQLEFAPQDRLRLTARVGRRRVHIPLTNLK